MIRAAPRFCYPRVPQLVVAGLVPAIHDLLWSLVTGVLRYPFRGALRRAMNRPPATTRYRPNFRIKEADDAPHAPALRIQKGGCYPPMLMLP